MVRFTVVNRDAFIQCEIDDDGYATMSTDGVKDDEVLFQALVRVKRVGAKRGVFFTGDIVNDSELKKALARVQRGTTWLGGKLTRLNDGPLGPCFRVDWDDFPELTE